MLARHAARLRLNQKPCLRVASLAELSQVTTIAITTTYNNDSREEERRIKQAQLHTSLASLIFLIRLDLSRLHGHHSRILSAKRLWKLQWLQVQDLQTSVVTDTLCSKIV